MRVCIASFEIHPTTPGGAGMLVHHLARALLRDRHEVLLLLDLHPGRFEVFDRQHRPMLPSAHLCRALDVSALAPADRYTPVLAREGVAGIPLIQWQSERFARAMERVVAEHRPDVIELFDFSGACAGVVGRALMARDPWPPIHVRVHGPLVALDAAASGSAGAGALDPSRRLMHALEREVLAGADRVLVPSLAYWNAECAPHVRVLPERLRVVPPPRPTEPFERCWKGSIEPGSIVAVGSASAIKGTDALLDAVDAAFGDANLDPAWGLDLVGSVDPAMSARVAAACIGGLSGGASPAGPRVRAPGPTDREGVRDAFARATLAAFPNRTESFCYAAHEAFDVGCPMLLRAIPAFVDAFGPVRSPAPGVWFFAGDADLGPTLNRWMTDRVWRAAMREGARARPMRAGESRSAADLLGSEPRASFPRRWWPFRRGGS